MKYETIRLKLRKFYIRLTCNQRRRKIKYDDFTIISNNCWGGTVYQSYGLKYNTPTIGLYFIANDYIKFIYNIKEYLSYDLQFIKFSESKKAKLTGEKLNYPVGKLKDIEIYFMHYKTEEEAKEKWDRRKKRINWNRIIYKFSNQNFCTQKDVENFMKLPSENKICFVNNERYNIEGTIFIKQLFKSKDIKASYEPFGNNKTININNYINEL